MSLLLLILAATAATTAATDSDPLARARRGEVQCFHPDVLFKTCLSIENYVPTGPGAWIDKGANVVALNQPYVIETSVPTVVRGNAVCATMSASHLAGGKITANGVLVTPAKAAAITAQMKKTLANVIDREVCSTFEPTSGDGFIAKMRVNGGREVTSPFIWVKPSDGWQVSP